MVKGYAVPLDKTTQTVVVGNDTGNFDVELFRLPARQQVVEAMLLLADQDDDAFPGRRITDPPVHCQLARQRRKALA